MGRSAGVGSGVRNPQGALAFAMGLGAPGQFSFVLLVKHRDSRWVLIGGKSGRGSRSKTLGGAGTVSEEHRRSNLSIASSHSNDSGNSPAANGHHTVSFIQ
mgnify:CR=1 FL=1